ncbi:MAG: Dyp-type peroxidase, partial [Rhodoplanes sp.]
MRQILLTFGVPFDGARMTDVEDTLETHGQKLLRGGALRDVLRRQGVHFMSITVVPGDAGRPAHLMVEMSVDESEAAAERILSTLLAREIGAILGSAGLAHGGDVIALLRRHRIRTGSGLFDVPGLD